MPKIFRVASLPFCQRVHLLGCNILKIHTKEGEEIGNENSKKNVLYTRKFWHCTTILHDPRMNV